MFFFFFETQINLRVGNYFVFRNSRAEDQQEIINVIKLKKILTIIVAIVF